MGTAAGAVRGLHAVAAGRARRRGRPREPVGPSAGVLARGAGRPAAAAAPAHGPPPPPGDALRGRPGPLRHRPRPAAVRGEAGRRTGRHRVDGHALGAGGAPAPPRLRRRPAHRRAHHRPHRRGTARPRRLLRQHLGAARRPLRQPDLPRSARAGPRAVAGRLRQPGHALRAAGGAAQPAPVDRLQPVLPGHALLAAARAAAPTARPRRRGRAAGDPHGQVRPVLRPAPGQRRRRAVPAGVRHQPLRPGHRRGPRAALRPRPGPARGRPRTRGRHRRRARRDRA
ncbi:hypothetical protein STREPTOSP366_66430 [Streptomyces variabilis]